MSGNGEVNSTLAVLFASAGALFWFSGVFFGMAYCQKELRWALALAIIILAAFGGVLGWFIFEHCASCHTPRALSSF